jgi:Fur family transcriptional regulator, peroxide stress response regulator
MSKVAGQRNSGDPDSVPDIRALCQRAGLRLTPQREAIFTEILRRCDHPSAEEVHQMLRDRLPGLSLDTVYRTLGLLERHGAIRRLIGLDQRSRFDGQQAPHHHLMCRECHAIMDFCWSDFDHLALPAILGGWGRVEMRCLQLIGLCTACQGRQTRKRG